METRRGHLTADIVDGALHIGNGRVGVRLFKQDGGYAQEFYAGDRKGQFHLLLSSLHKNLIPASEHRACASPMIAGERPHLFGVCRESLRMVYSHAEVVHHDERRVAVCLSGSVQGHSLRCWISLEHGTNTAHVVVRDDIASNGSRPLVEYLMSSFAFVPDGQVLNVGEELDYAWAPTLRPADEQLIGDCAFHSPAAIVQHGHYAAALIPDLNILSGSRNMPASLDLDLNNGLLPAPLLSYGFCGYEQDGGVCRHDMTMAQRLDTPRLTYGCHLILDADCRHLSAHREAARFLWGRYGLQNRQKPARPQSRLGYQMADLHPDARTACGLQSMGSETGDEGLVYAARSMKNLLLDSPQREGLFPTGYDLERGEWTGCRASIPGARFHTVECSEQLCWLLRWYRNIDADPRIMTYCRAYADFLIAGRLRSGAIPSWYDNDLLPLSPLRSGVQTAASALFLAELGNVTGLAKYVSAAERSGDFVLSKLLAGPDHYDHTLIDAAKQCSIACVDPHTNVPPQSALAMLWVARLGMVLHKLKGNRRYLEQGTEALDRLCLLQAVWNKPWASHPEFGLLAKANIGWACDAELTAEFAHCAMDYGAVTGEREYSERGAAALSASLREARAGGASQARIAASAAAIRSDYGAAYVHVGKKWGIAIGDSQLRRLDVGHGTVSVEIGGRLAGSAKGRMVFGGMRGSSYKVCINGHWESRSREELESGIPLPQADAGDSPPTQFSLGL